MTVPFVRCVHDAATVPGLVAPHDTVHLRLFHPALLTGDERERQTGELPPDPARAPWPVVLVLPGVNVGPEGYRWLAEEWVGRGLAVVTMALVGEVMPGIAGITPGMDLDACRPGTYGSRPSCTVVGPVLRTLARHAAVGRLAGMLDLDRIVLAGHSAGGTMALENADPGWWPVRAVVTYASHTMASTMFDWPPATVLPVPAALPTLLMAGDEDGVMEASVARYRDRGGRPGDGDHDPVARTFREALPDRPAGTGADAYLAVLRGGTHTSVCWPDDTTSARGFLDPPPGRDPAAVRAGIAAISSAFLEAHVLGRAGAAARLDALLEDRDALARSDHRWGAAPEVGQK